MISMLQTTEMNEDTMAETAETVSSTPPVPRGSLDPPEKAVILEKREMYRRGERSYCPGDTLFTASVSAGNSPERTACSTPLQER